MDTWLDRMDWGEERYVRVYVRDTPDWQLLSYEAQALFFHLLRKADRSGLLETKKGPRALAALIRHPSVDKLTVELQELLDDTIVVEYESGYVIRNFLKAQEAQQHSAFRNQEWRERQKALRHRQALGLNIDEADRTDPDTTGQTRTNSDTDGPNRTPSRAKPSLAEPSQEEKTGAAHLPGSSRKLKGDPTPGERAQAMEVINSLNQHSGTQFKGGEAHVKLIVRQLRSGRSVLDLRKVAWYCAQVLGWGKEENAEKMGQFLRPETLFGPVSIEKYIDPAISKYRAKFNTDDDVAKKTDGSAGGM